MRFPYHTKLFTIHFLHICFNIFVLISGDMYVCKWDYRKLFFTNFAPVYQSHIESKFYLFLFIIQTKPKRISKLFSLSLFCVCFRSNERHNQVFKGKLDLLKIFAKIIRPTETGKAISVDPLTLTHSHI